MVKIANIGILLFCIFYLLAVAFYSGGNAWDHDSTHFSWLRNYWCDLTSTFTFKGKANTSRFYAYAAMCSLIVSLSIIWLRLPILMGRSNNLRAAKYFGITSLGLASTVVSLHEFAIYSGGAFAMISFIILLMHFWMDKDIIRFLIGTLVAISMIGCIVIYYFKIGIVFLPIVQKMAMVLILIWFLALNNKTLFTISK